MLSTEYATSSSTRYTGVLHHVIIREIEGRFIFKDDQSRENFIEMGLARRWTMKRQAVGYSISLGRQPAKRMDYRFTK